MLGDRAGDKIGLDLGFRAMQLHLGFREGIGANGMESEGTACVDPNYYLGKVGPYDHFLEKKLTCLDPLTTVDTNGVDRNSTEGIKQETQ